MKAASPSRDVVLSVVVPAHDEAPNLERLVAEVRAAVEPIGLTWELVVADDGSSDATPSILAALASGEPRLRTARLPQRCGQTRALEAGFRAARGTLLATLDADLQCPPGALPDLVRLVRDGEADLACGVRMRRHDPPSRRFASMLANVARRCVIAPGVRDLACPLRVFRADALATVPLFDGAHRWLPALFVLAGLRVVQRPVPHGPRTAGVSKYTTRGRLVPIARETGMVVGLMLRRLLGWRGAPVRVSP
jgi:dolichol-phosphate mannosyltransferase